MPEQIIEIDKDAVGAALGRVTSGVFITTAINKDHKVGMLTSWVQQVGFEPPVISVAVHPDRDLHKVIDVTQKFTVNVLSKNNTPLMKKFSHFQEDQFENLTLKESEYGIAFEDAIAHLQCELRRKVDAGTDHELFIAEIVGGELLKAKDDEPFMHVRKSGFSY